MKISASIKSAYEPGDFSRAPSGTIVSLIYRYDTIFIMR